MRAFFVVPVVQLLMRVKGTLNSVKTRRKSESWLATQQAHHYNVARRAVGRAGQCWLP